MAGSCSHACAGNHTVDPVSRLFPHDNNTHPHTRRNTCADALSIAYSQTRARTRILPDGRASQSMEMKAGSCSSCRKKSRDDSAGWKKTLLAPRKRSQQQDKRTRRRRRQAKPSSLIYGGNSKQATQARQDIVWRQEGGPGATDEGCAIIIIMVMRQPLCAKHINQVGQPNTKAAACSQGHTQGRKEDKGANGQTDREDGVAGSP